MADFDESKHPRDDDGKFTSGGGASGEKKDGEKKLTLKKPKQSKYPGWRNMTAAQRYNAKADEIFDYKKRLDNAQAKYLAKLGVSADEIEKLRGDLNLQKKLIELGKKDEFYSLYDSETGELKDMPETTEKTQKPTEEEMKGAFDKYYKIGFDEFAKKYGREPKNEEVAALKIMADITAGMELAANKSDNKPTQGGRFI